MLTRNKAIKWNYFHSPSLPSITQKTRLQRCHPFLLIMALNRKPIDSLKRITPMHNNR